VLKHFCAGWKEVGRDWTREGSRKGGGEEFLGSRGRVSSESVSLLQKNIFCAGWKEVFGASSGK
jgi:hypothetical protein